VGRKESEGKNEGKNRRKGEVKSRKEGFCEERTREGKKKQGKKKMVCVSL